MSGVPAPVPTPYQSPSQGGNPYLQPGTTGQAVPSGAIPLYGPATPSGGVQFSSGAIYPNSSVLGAAIGPTASPSPQPPPSNPGPTSPTGGGTPSGQNNNTQTNLPSLDSLFGGEMGFLEGLKPQISQQQKQGNDLVDTQYQGQSKNIADQLLGLQNQLGVDTNNFNYGVNSAYSQAQNAYNQLLQRNLSLYGGGSSAGPAIAAILGQGYQQQTGGLQNQDLSGHQQLAQQGQDISTWGDSQMNTLGNWRDQAHLQINNIAQQGLNQINSQEGMAADAKTQAKMELLQNVINMRSAVEDYHTQLATQLTALGSMNNPSQYGVNNYDAGNYGQIMQALQGQISQMPLQLQQQVGQSAGLNPQQVGQFVGGLYNGGYYGDNRNNIDQIQNQLFGSSANGAQG